MPKLDEDDFVDPGNLPQISQSRTPPPGQTAGGFGSGFGSNTSASTGFGSPSAGGYGSGFGSNTSAGGFGSSVPSQGFATAQNNNNTSSQAAGAMHSGGESTVALDKDTTDWINKKMRPMMGWIYMLTCTKDFVIFPILWSLLQALSHGSVNSQWQPITLQGAGLYHIAMGAVLGIAAYGRTKEKVAGVSS
jgi:hypothetical protein